ncbi:MAG: discoidin domain-containing protein [Polyangiaceae bacterium]
MTHAESKSHDTRLELERLAAVREFFVMRQPLAHSRSRPEERRAAALPLERAARERLSAAGLLWARGKGSQALLLYRDAALLFGDAFGTAEGLEAVDSKAPDVRFAELTRLFSPSTRRDTEASESLARLGTLVRADPLELGRLSGPEGSSEISEFARAVHWLAERLDLRTPLSIQLHRASRVGIALAVFAVVLAAITAWAFPPVDLALNKPVRASSHAYDTLPEGAVDGIRYGQLGFHSGNDATPWLIVDLGRVTTFREVKVVGRAECCYDQAIPLAVEVSQDGQAFSEIARRTEPFTQYEPWVVHPGPTQARYIRLRTLRHSYLVLSELEVY